MAEQINLSIFSPSLTADTPALPGTFPQNRIRAAFSWLHLYRGFWLFSLLLASCMIIFSAKYYPTYQVLLNGNPLGMVAQKEDLAPALSEAEATASQLLGRKYHFPSTEVSYRLVYTYGNQYSSSAALQNALLNSVDEIRLLYVLRVDGTPVGASPSQFILLQSLQKILHTYQGENVQSVQFANAVSIHQEYVHKSMEKTGSQILSALQGKTENNQIYAAQPGDTLQSISNAIDVPLEILCKLNPDLIGETIAKPRTILLNEAPPLLSVYVKKTATHTEEIPFTTKTIPDASLYEGTQKIKTAGIAGKRQVTEIQTLKNHQLLSSMVISEQVIKEPVAEVVALGTKERPKTAPAGSFSWPVTGTITSPFGRRFIFGSSGFHSGIDIAKQGGSPIRAADGGTVTYTGYKGSYGNLVILDHGNGLQTYYAHCSKILVSPGTAVAKGQEIAHVGATGRATGKHLHFEIRVNGTAVNPISYLP